MDCAILLTAPGTSAIAVVRIVGAGVQPFLRAHFSKPLAPLRCTHGDLRDADRIIDDPVIVLHEDQQVADINLHGGAWVVQACLDLLRTEHFQIVERLETNLDAADGDNVLERELFAHLPMATTELAVRAMLEQPRAWTEFIASNPPAESIRAIRDDRALWWLLHPPTIAIVGAANVGKSTLANQLFGEKRSLTADVPGTTRDWVGEMANIDGLPAMLIDTPGIRQTTDAIESAAIVRATEKAKCADLTIVLLDASRSIEEQQELIDQYPGAMRVANKLDLPSQWAIDRMLGIVATRQSTIGLLSEEIIRRFGCAEFDFTRPRWWTARQRDILEFAVVDRGQLQRVRS